MAPDGRTDGHGQTYIPPPSAGDKKYNVKDTASFLFQRKAMLIRKSRFHETGSRMTAPLTEKTLIPSRNIIYPFRKATIYHYGLFPLEIYLVAILYATTLNNYPIFYLSLKVPSQLENLL